MGTTKFTDFGLCVKKRLLDVGMTQRELEQHISDSKGLYMDSGYMNKILTGKRKAPRVVEAICETLDIPVVFVSQD